MDEKLKWVLGIIGVLMGYTLYQSYQVPPDTGNGENGDETGSLTYTLNTEGPGYVEVYIGDELQGQFENQSKTFREINFGTLITLEAYPEDGARLVNMTNQNFTLSENTTSEVVFAAGSGTGDNPYGLTDEAWNVCDNLVQNILEDPSSWTDSMPIWPWWRRNRVVFGFAGWFNDAQLKLKDESGNKKSNETYAQEVADILLIGAPEPIIDCHIEVNDPKLGSSAQIMSKDEIIQKIYNVEGS